MNEINHLKVLLLMQNDVVDDVRWMLTWYDLIGF
jgi:hypothetical protein